MNTKPLELRITTDALDRDGKFKLDYTGQGADKSPAFVIENLPTEAKSLAITLSDVFFDPPLTHWLVWNLPATQQIPSAIPAGEEVEFMGTKIRQGAGYGVHRYAGPNPPHHARHTYEFTIYALDDTLELPSDSSSEDLLVAMSGHILARGVICGVFE